MGADQPVAQTPLSDQELLRLLKRAADDLNRTFDERYRAIENFRPDDAQGQPMFS